MEKKTLKGKGKKRSSSFWGNGRRRGIRVKELEREEVGGAA